MMEVQGRAGKPSQQGKVRLSPNKPYSRSQGSVLPLDYIAAASLFTKRCNSSTYLPRCHATRRRRRPKRHPREDTEGPDAKQLLRVCSGSGKTSRPPTRPGARPPLSPGDETGGEAGGRRCEEAFPRDPSGDPSQQEAKQREAEIRNTILAQVLDQAARARLSNLALVKPDKAKAVENYLIQMARFGQLPGKVSEQGLIEILEKVSQQTEKKTTVKFNRRKVLDSDEEDDY
nr:PREDICTED: programmed cell death protein 5 [Struthio camelus australis]